MSNVPPFGDKQRMVGPGGGGGSGPDPAENAPPEVQESSVLGIVLRYALEDHTHQSPVIYWPQGVGPNANIVSNRSGYITVTTSTFGGTNFCTYETDSAIAGLLGDFSVIGGGYENEDHGSRDVIAGGAFNTILYDDAFDCESVISGGTLNLIDYFSQSAIAGGYSNTIQGVVPGYYGYGAFIGGGWGNVVNYSGGVAHGVYAKSYSPGQSSFASGSSTTTPGTEQHSKVVISGFTDAGSSATIDLVPQIEPGNVILAQPSTTGVGTVQVIATKDGGSSDYHAWIIGFCYLTDAAGVVTILSQSVIWEASAGGGVLFLATLSSGGTQINVTVDKNGGDTGQYNCCATLKQTEIFNGAV